MEPPAGQRPQVAKEKFLPMVSSGTSWHNRVLTEVPRCRGPLVMEANEQELHLSPLELVDRRLPTCSSEPPLLQNNSGPIFGAAM